LQKEDIVGKKATELFPSINDDHPQLLEIYGEAALLGRKKSFEIYFKPLNIWLSISVYSTQREYFTAVFNNITERKKAEEKIKKYQHRLKALASQLTLTEEKERRRLASELHDHVGQSLALTRMQLATARKGLPPGERLDAQLEDISQSLFQIIRDTRHLIFDLSSPSLNELGLGAAIGEWMEEQAATKHGLQVELFDHAKNVTLDVNLRAILFRNVRELLTNVIKHAQAKSLSVRLEGTADYLDITIQDDGLGFDPTVALHGVNARERFGLFSVQERMTDLGGKLDIVSQPGAGCKAVLHLAIQTQTQNPDTHA